jgi:hypothetical protein
VLFLGIILIENDHFYYLNYIGVQKASISICCLDASMFLLCRFVDRRSIETQTNPIDRSIALLLFHQPSDQVAGAVDNPRH